MALALCSRLSHCDESRSLSETFPGQSPRSHIRCAHVRLRESGAFTSRLTHRRKRCGMATHVLVRRPFGTVLRTSKRRFPTRLSPCDGVLIAMREQSAKPVALCAALATARLQKWRWLFALASCIAMKAVPSRKPSLASHPVRTSGVLALLGLSLSSPFGPSSFGSDVQLCSRQSCRLRESDTFTSRLPHHAARVAWCRPSLRDPPAAVPIRS